MIKVGSMKPFLGAQSRIGHPLAAGLVGCWLMNEGSGQKIYDLSGNNNTGTFYGDTKWASGKFGPCLSFDGSGDYVQCQNNLVDNTLYFSCWVYFNSISGYPTFLTWNGESVGSESIGLYSSRWDFWSSAGTFDIWPASPTPSVQTWYHVVAGFQSGIAAYFYINGTLVGSDITVGTPTKGSLCFSSKSSPYFHNGLIDNMLIYKRALTAAEIMQLYLDPFCIFRRQP